jgi:RNA polymerase sigma factor (sigma-70 family)
MATGQLSGVVRHLHRAALLPDGGGMTDRQLLERFLTQRDEDAFEALVRRHGPMVWGVCRRVLHHLHDAEDAFQATFLVLARKAVAIRQRESVGSWLYGAAFRSALEAKAVRRRSRERQVSAMPEPEAVVEADIWSDVRPLLDQELDRLPDKYREAVVLCDLEGKTRKEAARQLGVPEGTLSGRLTTARRMLAGRLARHGLAVSGGALAAVLSQGAASACVPKSLVVPTAKAAAPVAAGQAAAAGVISTQVAALTEGVLKTMLLTKLRLTAALFLAAAVFGTGLGLLVGQGLAGDEKGARAPEAPKPAAEGAKDPAPGADLKSLQQALQAASDIKDPEQKVRALILVAQAQVNAGERAAALQTLQRAFKLGDALPNDDKHDFYVRLSVLGLIVGAQAEAGDVDAARKTIEVMRMPKVEKVEGVYVVDPEFLENTRASCHVQIAVAQARAGKAKEAAETVGQLDEMRREGFGSPALAEIAAAQARAGDWKRAEETVKSIKNDVFQVPAWIEIAKLQAKAGKGDAARASIVEALRAIPPEIPEDAVGLARRAGGLELVALAQAELGDRKTALLTAESIPNLPPVGDAKALQFPYKEMSLAMLQAKGGDYKAAKKAAEAIDANYQGGSTKAYAFRLIARTQAEAKDIKGALETTDAIEHGFNKAAAYTEIAQAQARAGDHDGAAQTFEKALGFAEAVPEVPNKSDLDRASLRPLLLRTLASAQAEAGQEKAAGEWIAKQSSPNLKAWAFVGLAEGIVKRQAANKQAPR